MSETNSLVRTWRFTEESARTGASAAENVSERSRMSMARAASALAGLAAGSVAMRGVLAESPASGKSWQTSRNDPSLAAGPDFRWLRALVPHAEKP